MNNEQKKKQAQEAKAFLAQGRAVKKGSIAFMLRTCGAKMNAYNGFVWPKAGPVTCPDWRKDSRCGHGLHGLLWGEGDVNLTAHQNPGATWLVCAVWAADVIDLDGKVKAPRAFVVFCGSRVDAVKKIQALGAEKPIFGTATAGDDGTATAGDDGTATAGNRGTATVGNRGTATVGNIGTATAGYHGTATAGYHGTATVGNSGTATAGEGGTATAGDSGTATAGEGGTATAGNRGTATAGEGGTATAGYHGVICIIRWNGKRYKPVFASVGENGIEPNVKYRLDQNGCFVRADGVK